MDAKPAVPTVVVAESTDKPAEKKEPEKPKPAGPKSQAKADQVYAKLVLHPTPEGEKSKPAEGPVPGREGMNGTEFEMVYLRGKVTFHEDPAEGKERGTDVQGEAVDINNQGKNVNQFVVFNTNPQATKAQPTTQPEFDIVQLARVETEEMTILGAFIGIDQLHDAAWVNGLGSLTQMTERGLFTDKDATKATPAKPEYAEARAKDKARQGTATTSTTISKTKSKTAAKDKSALATADAPPAKTKKVPMTITFAYGMRFYGQPVREDLATVRAEFVRKKFTDREADPDEWPAARAEFYQNVHVEMEDSRVDCGDNMMVYLDRPVKLARPATDPPKTDDAKKPAADSEKADIALVECVEKVRVMNWKLDPNNADSVGNKYVLEKQVIEGEYLVYDKVSGKFRVPGAGQGLSLSARGAGGHEGRSGRPRREPTRRLRSRGSNRYRRRHDLAHGCPVSNTSGGWSQHIHCSNDD